MALVLANRVQETATANTTVSFTLTGAVTGFQSFAVIGNTNTTFYSATDGSGNWEVGLGTYSTTGPTLTRTTVYASSNSGSAVTFSGAVSIFVTYPSERSVNLDASGNVSALGTVASGTWQGSTVGVAYGGTGVTTSSGANSVVLRDSNQNITVNRLSQSTNTVTASGGTTTLTAASAYNQTLVGTGGPSYRLPDATTLTGTILYAKWARIQKTVWLQVQFQSTGAGAANGIISVSYPSGLTPVQVSGDKTIGTFQILDSGTAWYFGSAAATNPCQGLAYGGGNYMGAATPAMTIANNDVISIAVCYEVA